MITSVGLMVEYVPSSGSGEVQDSQPIYTKGVLWEYTYPDQDMTSQGGWMTETSGSPLYPSIDEHDAPVDSDYAWIDGPQVGDYFEVDLEGSEFEEDLNGDVTIFWRAKNLGQGASLSMKMELREGASVRASDTQTLTGVATTFARILTQVEKDSITDWNNLSVRFTIMGVS
jgi:hypothetical protein